MAKTTTRWIVAIAAVCGVCASGRSDALPSDALAYARGYLLTGNYVAGGVDLTEQSNPIDAQGFSTGTIHISGVPADADIQAAYLYFETITPTASLSSAAGAAFRGQTILLNDLMAVKKSRQNLSGPTASCWSSGTPLTITEFRVDVLRWLPIRLDKDNKPTGKRLVNDADLIAHGLPLNQVKLPVRAGNQVPESAGASLVVIYRDPSQPLRKIVLYDGIHVQTSASELTTQTLRGFYRSSAIKSAKLTHIIASGQPNNKEGIYFDDAGNDPFNGQSNLISGPDPISGGSASQRGWSTLTYDVSTYMKPGSGSGSPYGEAAKTILGHTGGGYDCLTMAAVVFSTAVADVDHDGLPDGLEDAAGGLTDPDGTALPNLNAMGASSNHPDIFLEFNALWAPANTSYGSSSTPYNSKTTTMTDPAGHNHMPTPDMLKMVGDAYVAHGITPHFDVGDIDTYHQANPLSDPQKLGVVQHVDWVDDYTSNVADSYLVPSAYARGGEVIKEAACSAANPQCLFPDFPGTVGWKFGLQVYRDQPVGDGGEEVSLHPGDPGYFNWNAGTHRRRFDRNRSGLFHYVLYAHARGNPKSDLPCMIGGVPGPYASGTSCGGGAANPDFHHPTTASGVADLPGSNVLVTLGLWDDFVGRPFVRASTTFHETGHNLNLWHGGLPATWGNLHPVIGPPTSTYIEPNCKPNYLSTMSYLFQVSGLFDRFDNIHLDYSDRDFSGSWLNMLNETAPLSDGVPPEPPASLYVPAWFAPAASPLALSQAAPASTRFCDGTQFGAVPPPSMARVHAVDIFSPIDWDGDPATAATAGAANVNFDAAAGGVPTFSTALHAFNDWTAIRLDQLGAGRNAVKFSDELLADFGSGDFTDFGSGDFTDYGSGDFTDFGSGDFTDFGSGVFLSDSSGDFLDFGSGDFTDFGSGDFTDFGSGDFLDFGTGSERQELDFDVARGLTQSSPYSLTACIVGRDAGCMSSVLPFDPRYHKVDVSFSSSPVGHVFQYVVERKKGNAASASPYVAAGTTTTKSFVDPAELTDSQTYTYHVRTEFDDDTPHTFSPWSQPVTIAAVNDKPTANSQTGAQTVVTLEDTPVAITLTASDVDSLGPLGFTIVTPPAHGTLVGTPPNLTYYPYPNSNSDDGPESFTFKANDTKAPFNDPGRDSDVATVSISVTPVNDRPSFTKGPGQTVLQDSGPQTVVMWATNFSPGPANESSQAILAYHVVSNTNPALFSAAPSISTAGTLTYTPAAGATGTATIGVTVQDTGGTLNGGLDTSDPPQTFTITVKPVSKLTSAGPADVWLGLTKSADVGTRFDVQAEVVKNSSVVASGVLGAITLGSNSDFDFDDALLKTINLAAVAGGLPASLGTGDALSVRLSVKVSSTSTHATGTARLWFNVPGGPTDGSHLHATVGGSADKYYLTGSAPTHAPGTFTLKKNAAGTGSIQWIDVAASKAAFQVVGTWTFVMP